MRNYKIAIIGQGYVGLPLAIEFGKKYKTVGFDINSERISELKKFNDKTKDRMGQPVPVVITVYKDKKFDFVIKTPPASHLIKEAIKLKSGSKEPGRVIAGSITKEQLKKIAEAKMTDLNAFDIEEAIKIIAGSARSMGIQVKE